MIVIDDHTLVAVLAQEADRGLHRQFEASEVFTTGSWYYQLARARSGIGNPLARCPGASRALPPRFVRK